ncbi:hypothetical protein HGA13_14730 [Nocardia speluncae]|uniref:Uncharacterized protein n=1 Tax=Nocardia speluncae TaxID=419477 RepID=A0A846XIA8_9NOCA|nr:hypothetical protein [Nocardia speluncae]NKY34323.1 hypothetical protein [Nocardia speluncae]
MENRKCSELFEIGSRALRYFEILEVRYVRWVHEHTTPDFKTYADLVALLYKLNGLNEDSFRGCANSLKDVLGKVEHERTQQVVFAQTLPSVWWGEAATMASNMMAEQLRLSADDIAVLRRVHEEMDATPQGLREALGIIANAATGISVDHDITVHGKSPEDIDNIISYAEGDWSSTIGFGDTLLDKVNRIFPEHKATGMSGWTAEDATTTVYHEDGTKTTVDSSGPTAKLRDHCKWWLDNIFRTDYESNITEFVNACNQANQAVTTTYDELVKDFAGLNATKYPCPSSSQAPQTTAPAGVAPGQPATPGAPSTPGTPSAPGQPGAPGAPSTTAPNAENPLSALASLGTQLASSSVGSQLAQGLNGLLSSASEQVTSTLEQLREEAEKVIDPEDEGSDADGDGKPDKDLDGDGKPDADNDSGVEFNGKEYRLEVGSDGQLKLVVEAPEGGPQTFHVEIGADGKPKIVGEGEPEQAAPPSAEGQQPTAPPVGVPGAPTGQRQEDGEHQPQNYPTPQEPDEGNHEPDPPAPPPTPAVDTGAQLAEAGPL